MDNRLHARLLGSLLLAVSVLSVGGGCAPAESDGSSGGTAGAGGEGGGAGGMGGGTGGVGGGTGGVGGGTGGVGGGTGGVSGGTGGVGGGTGGVGGGTGGSTQIPGTHFAETATEWSLPAGSPSPDGFWTVFHRDWWTTMDLDGDGKPDLVVTEGASETDRRWLLYKNTGSGFAATSQDWALPADSPSPDGYWTAFHSDWWTTMDLDGDGKPDLVVTEGASETNRRWMVYRNTGSGFAATATEWSLPSNSPSPDGFWNVNHPYWWTTVDLDGDRKPDLVVTEGASETDRRWMVYKNTGSGFAATATEWSVPPNSPSPDGFWNVNHPDGWWTTMDLDGDRKPDLVVTAGASETDRRWLVHKNTGSGFAATATEWSLPADSPSPDGFWNVNHAYWWTTMDLDGDGKPDLVVTEGASEIDRRWMVHKNTGSGFAATASEWSLPADSPSPDGYWTVFHSDWWTTMDLDGDGKPDLVVSAGASETERRWLVFKNTP